MMFDRQWQAISSLCHDEASRQRLAWLQVQYGSRRYGVSEAAQAEVELATLLTNAGFSVVFLPESDAPTADLECYLGPSRVFVEVTVIVGGGSPVLRKKVEHPVDEGDGQSIQWDAHERIFVKRIVARIKEKDRQLLNYCAPVVLALTVYSPERLGSKREEKIKIDFQRLLGVIATTFPLVHQTSALFLTLLDLPAKPSQASIRLNNVYVGDGFRKENGASRIRLLAVNPYATYPLDGVMIQALKTVLS